ncbi:MAG: glutamine synthetase family protein [Pseudomonadota bacterium]
MTDIFRTRAMFCDLLNLPRGKYVPPDYAAGGKVGFARGVFGTTYDRDLIPVPGAGVFDGLPDMDLVLDDDRRASWQAGTEIALGDLHVDGVPFGLCPRGALKRAIAAWGAQGLTPMIGLEFEGYLFQRDDDGVWRPYDTPGAFVYGTGALNDPRGFLDAIWEAAHACGLRVESTNGEFDNGQFELTMGFAEALRACDDAFLFRTLARDMAAQKGLMLTFLAKPIPDRGGSGLHVNFSLADAQGQNVIAPDGTLSEVAEGAVAGLLAHHEGLAALLAMTMNSYDRLTPASMSGYWANWAEDHRLVTIRSATGSPKSARLEHRTADGATSPYIAVAAVLQAALLGVTGGLPLPKAEDLDGIDNVRATRHVPPTLLRALDALDADQALRMAVGEEICDALLFLKRDEAKRLSDKSVGEVRDYYLPFV